MHFMWTTFSKITTNFAGGLDDRAKHNVALKICTSKGPRGGTLELGILDGVKTQLVSHPGSNRVLQLLHSFKHKGLNGNHLCLVFDLMGPDLEDYRNLFPGRRLPASLVKRLIRQLLYGLSALHNACNVIHAGQHAAYCLSWIAASKGKCRGRT